jgi:hypothetical protein
LSTGVLLETGTADPSWAHGFTSFVLVRAVLLIFLLFCIMFCFVLCVLHPVLPVSPKIWSIGFLHEEERKNNDTNIYF